MPQKNSPRPTLAVVLILGAIASAIYFLPNITLAALGFQSLQNFLIGSWVAQNSPFFLLVPAALIGAAALIIFMPKKR